MSTANFFWCYLFDRRTSFVLIIKTFKKVISYLVVKMYVGDETPELPAGSVVFELY